MNPLDRISTFSQRLQIYTTRHALEPWTSYEFQHKALERSTGFRYSRAPLSHLKSDAIEFTYYIPGRRDHRTSTT
jgi:hypothetical protein